MRYNICDKALKCRKRIHDWRTTFHYVCSCSRENWNMITNTLLIRFSTTLYVIVSAFICFQSASISFWRKRSRVWENKQLSNAGYFRKVLGLISASSSFLFGHWHLLTSSYWIYLKRKLLSCFPNIIVRNYAQSHSVYFYPCQLVLFGRETSNLKVSFPPSFLLWKVFSWLGLYSVPFCCNFLRSIQLGLLKTEEECSSLLKTITAYVGGSSRKNRNVYIILNMTPKIFTMDPCTEQEGFSKSLGQSPSLQNYLKINKNGGDFKEKTKSCMVATQLPFWEKSIGRKERGYGGRARKEAPGWEKEETLRGCINTLRVKGK